MKLIKCIGYDYKDNIKFNQSEKPEYNKYAFITANIEKRDEFMEYKLTCMGYRRNHHTFGCWKYEVVK
jgi:hypothetical protein